MTARRVNQTQKDASEFGVGVRCGGWRLGLLVARNVAPAKAGRPKADDNRSPENEKVSMNRFAELAGVSPSHVKYYYDAWEFAAQASLVPKAESIPLGDDEICIDVDAIEDEDNERTHWSFFYQMAKNPPDKAKPKKEEKQKPEPKPKPEEVDSDFGIESDAEDEQTTKDELAQIDSAIQRNELLEILESVQALSGRLARVDGTITAENSGLIDQIGSAAMDLSTMAMSRSAVEAEKEKAA